MSWLQVNLIFYILSLCSVLSSQWTKKSSRTSITCRLCEWRNVKWACSSAYCGSLWRMLLVWRELLWNTARYVFLKSWEWFMLSWFSSLSLAALINLLCYVKYSTEYAYAKKYGQRKIAPRYLKLLCYDHYDLKLIGIKYKETNTSNLFGLLMGIRSKLEEYTVLLTRYSVLILSKS